MKDQGQEFEVGKDKIRLSEDNIIHVTARGDFDDDAAIELKKLAFTLLGTANKPLNLLIDLNASGKPSSKAREVFRQIIEHEKTGKVAYFGMNLVAKILAPFVMGATKKKDIRFFATEQEALAWFKE